MEEIETVSKVVDEAFEDSGLQQQSHDTVFERTKEQVTGTTHDQGLSGTPNDFKEWTLAAFRKFKVENKTEVYSFDNPAFEIKGISHAPRRKSFADIVTKLLNDPIKVDTHPYGRGSIYSRALGGEQPSIPREEGALFMWALVTLIILGVAVGVIVLSLMYQANQRVQDTPLDGHVDSNETSY